MSVQLTPRLQTAVGYIRRDVLLLDIGTDHAYLPIFLCEAGILTGHGRDDGLCAVASDVRDGPVACADRHIAEAGLRDRIRTVCTDGLDGLDGYGPADITVFGMGGELIVSILEAAPFVRHPGWRLILQPMTHAEKLRDFLFRSGFTVIGETVSREGKRLYQTICAEMHPAAAGGIAPTPAELAVGRVSDHTSDPPERLLYRELIEEEIRKETVVRDARRRAGKDTEACERLLAGLAGLAGQVSYL